MWVGNIPSDATHDELQKFFNQPLASTTGDSSTSARRPPTDHQRGSGVTSIFPIPKSSCVFVNYRAEEYLTHAIETFNGRPLRPYDPRSLKLVCRVRKRDDDLKAGVGGQRGQGLHTKWIKDQRLKGKHVQSGTPVPVADHYSQASGVGAQDGVDQLTTHTSDLTLSSDEEGKRRTQTSHRSSSGSFTSTDSSFLSNFFPERYFILKSLTQYDLDLSVQHGVWATQKHNEGILDQAYRTSKDVFLIFGVNKSGEFYGYAKMAGPLQHGEKDIMWASRTPRLPSRPGTSGSTTQATSPNPTENRAAPERFTGGGDDVSSKTPGPKRDLNSAPAELGQSRTRPSLGGSNEARSSTLPDEGFALDPQAPLRAIRTQAKSRPAAGPSLLMVDEEHEDDTGADDESRHGREDTWGDSFRVEWLCTERLPFHWTRNLRNPWNHDKEVKISRDGTELEPSVGETLLNAWEVMRASGGEIPSNLPISGNTARRGQHARKHNPMGRSVEESTPKGQTRS
ncbi:hypothetical protein P691DRAFT_663895 [Macrolepiota fuliginosa MF-IS2]|uniref:YTH domain-containing protein n=1 Tax=Macrolepiota fuliginosa MF-IS2 TaxID=1400762 RepID=A0A9P5XGS3_9AGAR|nr:hypothetical protein P691DRAFT_663895 [Macrolepiota fuliginosa MF-IS2]